ncbi:MAG: ABC transporter permease [Cytophagia bacterium]|nr:MAG: ABC transporter permease [Runella sp.]TAG23096.1 MAG: ABC transporter permease [Cytophagales bacterium]TAG36738.1 MAG: ABC transporter permease [Cytophagia bacterium]TAG83988.1 MAG: ABC transporter permease [Cytophagales bacterium]
MKNQFLTPIGGLGANYLKITFRQLWRNRLFTGLNVLGLSIGIAACWIIFQMVSYEFSFDADHPNANRIYKVVSLFKFDGKESGNAGTPKPMAEAIKKEVGGVETVVGVYSYWVSSLKVPQATGKPTVFEDIDALIATTNDYFKLVPYNWLSGSETAALSKPNQVVLTKSRAERYFPNQTPAQMLGKTLLYWDTLAVEVTGIVADLEAAGSGRSTSFSDQEFLSLATVQTGNKIKEFTEPESWGNTNSSDQVYILANEKTNATQLEKQVNAVAFKYSEAELKKWGDASRKQQLLPLKDVHFATDFGDNNRKADRNVLYALMGLAVFLLLLAIINYVNLSTAQIPQRAKEIGIKKTLGSPRAQLIANFLGETALVTLLACGLAYGWTQLFNNSFGDLLPEGIALYQNVGQMLGFVALLVVVVSLLSGWYPSLLITRFQPVQVLRGQLSFSIGKNRFTLRKSLIVFQFIVAQAFIMGALIWNQQLNYALTANLGFEREAILTVQVPWKLSQNPLYANKQFTLKQELKRIPEVAAVSLGNPPFNQSFSSNTHKYKGKKGEIERNVYRKYVDNDLIDLYGMKLLAGRKLQPSDTIKEYVINATAAREFGFASPQEAIGKYLSQNNGTILIPIVGVVSDFHTASFAQKIDPVALMTQKQNLSNFNIKMASSKPADWQVGIKKMEKIWKQTYPSAPFEYKFYDDMIAQFYETERNQARIVNLATIIAILISCLGLFGLATLTAFQRTKEIGIRKVLGASIANLVGLLSADFIKLILIALVVASPLAYFLMSKYLENYVYRVEIQWTVFAFAAILAVLIALLTVSYQAIKAALANPVESLKTE